MQMISYHGSCHMITTAVALTQKFSKDTGSDYDLNPACPDGN